MSALIYLKYRSFINSLKELKEKPGKLISALIYLGVLGFILMGPGSSEALDDGVQIDGLPNAPQLILSAGLLVLATIINAISWHAGTKTGINIFTLPDTQFLFTAPFHPATVLLYGMLNQLTTAILSSVFLLYQVPNLTRMGVKPSQIILLFIAWIFMIFVNHIISTFVYAFSASNPRRKRLMITIFYIIMTLPFLIFALMYFYQKDILEALISYLKSPLLYLVPVSGWLKGLIDWFYVGFSWYRLIASCLFFIFPAALMYKVYHMDIDYYEDALTMSQESPTTKGNKEAVEAAQKKSYGKLKTRRLGINKGFGESAIFYKQWRENRRSRPYFIGTAMVIFIVLLGFVAFIGKGAEEIIPFILWGVSAGLLFFISFSSSTISAFNDFQFFLLPGNPLKKVFYASVLSIVLRCIDLIPAYILAIILLRGNVLLIPVGLLLSLSVLLTLNAAHILTFLLIGEIETILSTMILFSLGVVFALPSIGITIGAAYLQFNQQFGIAKLLMLVLFVVNVGIGFLGLVFGKKYLEKGPSR